MASRKWNKVIIGGNERNKSSIVSDDFKNYNTKTEIGCYRCTFYMYNNFMSTRVPQ